MRWPTAEPNARAGLLIRESNDGRWVTGIAWEDYVSVQDRAKRKRSGAGSILYAGKNV